MEWKAYKAWKLLSFLSFIDKVVYMDVNNIIPDNVDNIIGNKKLLNFYNGRRINMTLYEELADEFLYEKISNVVYSYEDNFKNPIIDDKYYKSNLTALKFRWCFYGIKMLRKLPRSKQRKLRNRVIRRFRNLSRKYNSL